MKRNPKDEYTTVEENEYMIEDASTEERLLFLIDEEKRIVFRSFLEEDINPFIDMYDATAKEKRQKKRILYEELPKKGSQMYFFAIEKIIGEKQTGKWDEIYGLERIPIGIGTRSTEATILELDNQKAAIQAYVYTQYENMTVDVRDVIMKVAEIFNMHIDGMPKIISCK